jgi:cell wall-associated NlpC family hydrolase
MDRRLAPANGRVAALRLKGRVEAETFTAGTPRSVTVPLADLLAAPGGLRDRQLLWGEAVTVYEERQGWAFVEAARDGYVGYVEASALAAPVEPTHFVAVPASHLYPAPDIKTRELAGLSFGARFRVVSAAGNFFETAEGRFVPKPHLRPLNRPFTDPALVAQLFFGVPYLWGGNSIRGIDCSGLVQAAMLACGLPCPGDSDLQEETLGRPLDAAVPLRRGDLVFWKGHVAVAVDGETLIHANAHHMAVAYETAADAIARIESQGAGKPTSRRRPGQAA